jgi:hypothetical protein
MLRPCVCFDPGYALPPTVFLTRGLANGHLLSPAWVSARAPPLTAVLVCACVWLPPLPSSCWCRVHLDAATKGLAVRVAAVVGGLAKQKQERLLAGRPDVIVATPGRFMELVEGGEPYLAHLERLQVASACERGWGVLGGGPPCIGVVVVVLVECVVGPRGVLVHSAARAALG